MTAARQTTTHDVAAVYADDPRPAGRFLSREECAKIMERVDGMKHGDGTANAYLESAWTGNTRWGRNEIISSGDVRNNFVGISRRIRGAGGFSQINQVDPQALEAAVRRAERLVKIYPEALEAALEESYMEPFSEPKLWFDRTYALQAEERAEAMRKLVKPAKEAGMFAAGYIEVSARGRSLRAPDGKLLYYPFTLAQYSVTVRDPKGAGSGWAGVDWNDWGKIDGEHLSAIALDKCLRSRNPVAIEPGRYVTVLEPQATASLVGYLLYQPALNRYSAEESYERGPYSKRERGWSKIGEPIVDERVTIGADPMDPDIGFPPFSVFGEVYNPVNWIENGILQQLSYSRSAYGVPRLGINSGLPNSGAFKMKGGTTSIEDMIANTKRGVLVTRFSDLGILDVPSLLVTGITRDGFWLIENGKISKAIKNMRFTDSPLFALNNLLDLGPAQRVFSPEYPKFVPPIRVQDFSFTSLSDAI